MQEQLETGRKLDSKNSLQDFNSKERYLHPSVDQSFVPSKTEVEKKRKAKIKQGLINT